MKVVITIRDMDNAAFEGDPSQETARIIRKLADRIDGQPHFSPGHSQPLMDINGNEVGWFDVVEDYELEISS